VEQRELESVEDGRHVPAGTRGPAGDERVDDRGAGPRELGRADRIRGSAGERGDLGQRRPLQHHVGGAKPEPRGGGHKPGVGLRAVVARGDPQAKIGATEEVGGDGELTRDQQPRRERRRLLGHVELPG
jgi:hypothetical protein